MDNLSYIIGRNSAGGGTGSTPSWSDVTDKPFSTVGAGLEVSSGALKEAVPLYTETYDTEQSGSAEGYPSRDSEEQWSNEYIWNDERGMLTDAASIVSLSFTLEYGEVVQYDTFYSDTITTTTILDNTQVYTDSTGADWHIYLDNYQLHFECIDNLPYPVSSYMRFSVELGGGSSISGSANRQSYGTKYFNSFTLQDYMTANYVINSTTAPDLQFSYSYYDENQGSDVTATISEEGIDFSDSSAEYTDSENRTWHIYLDSYVFRFECNDEVPEGAASAYTMISYTYRQQGTTVHQLPAQYIPIDNNTIQTDWEGKLFANVSGGVNSVYYSDSTNGSTVLGWLQVDNAAYAITENPVTPDSKSIITNQYGQLEEAVPVYTESIGGTPGCMKLTNWVVGSNNDDADCYFTMPNGNLSLIANDANAYTVTGIINGNEYSGSWDASEFNGHTYGGFTWSANGQSYEFYIDAQDLQNNEYKAHFYLVGEGVSTVDYFLITPLDPNDTLETQLSVAGTNVQWQAGTPPTLQVHQLPAQYVPIDNSSLINDSGVLKGIIPAVTTTAGTYTLQATVDGNGVATYSWVAQV